ncbi:MAG TPA: hypothetical protein VNS79_03555 [Sphingobium sp.]|nr:hypothetical protein [Sphingobium sp.]
MVGPAAQQQVRYFNALIRPTLHYHMTQTRRLPSIQANFFLEFPGEWLPSSKDAKQAIMLRSCPYRGHQIFMPDRARGKGAKQGSSCIKAHQRAGPFGINAA